MLTKSLEVMRYIRASAGRAGLNVVWERTNQPRHDGNTIYLPMITVDTTEEDLKQLMASTDHEVGHDRFSDFGILQEKHIDTSDSVLGMLFNLIEDSRVNSIEATEYQGFRENWDECCAKLTENIGKQLSKKKDDDFSKLLGTLLRWEKESNAKLFPQQCLAGEAVPYDKAIMDKLLPFSKRLLETHSVLPKKEGSAATYELARDVYKALGGDPDKEEEKNKKEAEERAKGKGKPGEEGEGDEEGGGSEIPDEIEVTELKEGEPTDSKEFKIVKIKISHKLLKDAFPSTHDPKKSNIGTNIEWTDPDRGDWDLTPFEQFEVVNYPQNTGKPQYLTGESASLAANYRDRCAGAVEQDNFVQSVRRLIQIRAKVQREYGVKKGKLDSARISRICFDNPGLNEKVFKRKITNTTLDAAMTVLIDFSGSMDGSKSLYACASAIMMNKVCTTLNIPLEILGFTDARSDFSTVVPLMYIFKEFKSNHISEDELLRTFGIASHYMNGNPDGENILWAYERLLKRKEKKRCFIVMSDGQPAASKSCDGIEIFTLKTIREIEAARKVDIYGLGLCSYAVDEYYKAHSVVSRPDDIPHKLLELFERKVLS
jgi:cobaltochelatase CobT